MKEKNSTSPIKIVLIIACLILTIGGIAFAYFDIKLIGLMNENEDLPNNSNDDLYLEVINADLSNNYPKTPEEVVKFYNDTFQLLYGNEITDEKMIKNIISQQRMLYTEDLKSINNLDEQFENFKSSKKTIDSKNIIITGTNQSEPTINKDGICEINVVRYTNQDENLYYKFYLSKNKDTGIWKIARWETTDENYKVIEAPIQ